MKRFQKNLSRRLIDALVAASVRRGMGPSTRHLLTVTGRTTKVPHTTPVCVITVGPDRYLVGPYGERAWVRNARAARTVTLTRGGRSENLTVADVPPAEAAPVIRRYLEVEPITRPYFGVGPDAPDEALAAEAATHPVLRLTPAA